MNIDRLAFEAVKLLGPSHYQASLELPHLLRAHGLAATLGYWLAEPANNDVQGHHAVAASFVHALNKVCSIGGPNVQARANQLAEVLKSEPHPRYVLHSRLALRLADAWVLFARALLDTPDAITPPDDAEAQHA